MSEQPQGKDSYFSKDSKINVNKGTHASSDVDDNPDSLHHTLGNGIFQAAPGNHKHDERYNKIDTIYVPGTVNAPYGGFCDCFKNGKTVEVSVGLTNAAITAGNLIAVTVPVGFRPTFFNLGTRFYEGTDFATGAPCPMSLDFNGNLRVILGRAAGATSNGTITFVQFP